MKKICFINNLYSPYDRGGAEKVVEQRVEEYKNKGYQSIVISWKPWQGFNSWRPELEEKDGVKIYRFWIPNIFSYKNLSEHWFLSKLVWHFVDIFNIFSANIIEGILKKESPDIVETHNLMGIGFLTSRAIKGLNITHIHYLHDVQLVEPSGILSWDHSKDNFTQVVYSSILKILFDQPEKIISPSKFLKDFYQDRGFFLESDWKTKEFELQRQFIEPENIDYSRIIKFLFVGSLEEHKGLEVLKQSWGEYISAGKELHIVGGGSMKKEMRDWANNRQGVKMYGRMSKDRLVEKYKECDVLIFPSICIENSPNVIKEALEHNLFVVASKTGGVREFKNYNVWFFEPENITEIQKKIAEVSVNVLVKRGLSTEKKSQDEFEVNWAKYFIKYINKRLGANYKVVNNEEESSDIDVFAVSKSDKFNRLNIQLTQIHPEFFYQSVGINELVNTAKVNGGQPRIQFLIEDAIEKKVKQYSDPSNVILLLQGYFEIYKIEEAVENINTKKIKSWNFKGIYYAFPGINRGGVVVIKECFG